MTRDELRALDELSSNPKITIKQADKGGAIVVWDTKKYIAEANRQLSDTEVYQSLDRDPKWDISKKIQSVVAKALEEGLIDSDLSEFRIVQFPKTPLLYLLPKIHKSMEKRPIVSGRGSLLNKISIFLDRALRQLAMNTISYIQDTTDFLTKIQLLTTPEGALLVSFNVVSLYTSINHERGIYAVRRVLDTTDFSPRAKDFLIDLVTINLTNNYFSFATNFTCR